MLQELPEEVLLQMLLSGTTEGWPQLGTASQLSRTSRALFKLCKSVPHALPSDAVQPWHRAAREGPRLVHRLLAWRLPKWHGCYCLLGLLHRLVLRHRGLQRADALSWRYVEW